MKTSVFLTNTLSRFASAHLDSFLGPSRQARLSSYRSNVGVEGPWSAPCQLKKPFKGFVVRCVREKYFSEDGSLIRPSGKKSIIFLPICPPPLGCPKLCPNQTLDNIKFSFNINIKIFWHLVFKIYQYQNSSKTFFNIKINTNIKISPYSISKSISKLSKYWYWYWKSKKFGTKGLLFNLLWILSYLHME